MLRGETGAVRTVMGLSVEGRPSEEVVERD